MAMGMLASGVALGGVLGLLLGGSLEEHYGWRVAFMAVGVPGFFCALLAARLVDPTRPPAKLTVRSYLRNFEIGVTALLRNSVPLLAASLAGLACWPTSWTVIRRGLEARRRGVQRGRGARPGAQHPVLGALDARRTRRRRRRSARGMSSAFDDILRAGQTVLHTPTLVYVFLAGAMISFGMNGIVGWGPTFVARELELTAGEGAALLGKWGLVAGTAGTLSGGFLADWLRRSVRDRPRAHGRRSGSSSAARSPVWLLTIRDPGPVPAGLHRASSFSPGTTARSRR